MKTLTLSITLILLLADPSSTQIHAQENKAKEQPKKDAEPDLPRPDPMPEIAINAPDNRDKVLGNYLKPGEKEISVVLSSPVEKSAWQQLKPNAAVRAGQSYLALPGCRGDLQLQRVKLSLVGSLPEIVPAPMLLESSIDLHQHEQLAADLTLRRGRIVLTSDAEKPMVRIRFENPNFPEHGEVVDLVLHGKGTQVLIDRGGRIRPGKPFYKDPKDPRREPPGAFLGIWVLKGSVSVRHDTVSYLLSEPPGRAKLIWSSLRGLKMPELVAELPAIISLNPPLPEEMDKNKLKRREEILKARDLLAQEAPGKPISLRLALACGSSDVGRRILALRCYAALGAVAELAERLIDERDPATWAEAVACTKRWMAVSRDNEYRLHELLRKRFTAGETDKILELLHSFPSPDVLVEYLNNPQVILRRLAHSNLCELEPKGKDIPYDPRAEEAQRLEAQRAWTKLLRK